MIKLFLLPAILFFGNTPHPAISISNNGQMANNGRSMAKANSYEVAFFGDIFGEGALKYDCLMYWGIVPAIVDVNSYRNKCNKASAEIEFAKREYPGLLALAKSLKYTRVANGEPFALFNGIQELKRKCSDKTAIRAARTARYWGTTEVGSRAEVKNAVIAGFSDINPGQYAVILKACEKGSWLDKKLISLQDIVTNKVNDLGLATIEDSTFCDASTADKLKKSIGSEYVKNIQQQSREHRENLQQLDVLETAFDSMIINSNEIPENSELPFENIATARERLKEKLKACDNALAIARKHASDNQKAKRAIEKLERQYAAQEQERRRQNAARQQQEKRFRDAVDSVDIE